MASCAVGKPPHMPPDEKRLVREMHFDRLMKPADIARTVGRDISCVARLLKQTKAPNPVGRPAALSEAQVDKAVKEVDLMVDKADACSDVTVAMLLRRCRFKCCERVLSNALHSRGYYFHMLRRKMILTPDDVAARFAWAAGRLSEWLPACTANQNEAWIILACVGCSRAGAGTTSRPLVAK